MYSDLLTGRCCVLLYFLFGVMNSAVKWASVPSTESQGGPQFVWALDLTSFSGFPLPQAGWRGCWLHIPFPPSFFFHPSIPPSRHPPVSCLHSAALRLCHLGDTPDHQGPGGHLNLAARHRSPWERSEVLPWVEKRCWWWLRGGEFFFFTQAGRRLKVWLHLAWP